MLLNPGVEVSARDAYRWLDESGVLLPSGPVRHCSGAGRRCRKIPYFNALQAPVVPRHPPIQVALDALAAAGLHAPLMSGSGSTCFALAHDAAQAAQAALVLAARYPDWWVQATSTQEAADPEDK
ncbi:hypothetical protein ACFSC4_12920 [Deinococcus malanensis]|uniref:hypothetical protein n=1 Tax=Deinococcus malanensis TaxID=1706855 RepID=UPI0036290FD2